MTGAGWRTTLPVWSGPHACRSGPDVRPRRTTPCWPPAWPPSGSTAPSAPPATSRPAAPRASWPGGCCWPRRRRWRSGAATRWPCWRRRPRRRPPGWPAGTPRAGLPAAVRGRLHRRGVGAAAAVPGAGRLGRRAAGGAGGPGPRRPGARRPGGRPASPAPARLRGAAGVPLWVGRAAGVRRERGVEEGRRRADEERLRVARELHDVVSHSIAMINFRAGVALHVIDRRPQEAKAGRRGRPGRAWPSWPSWSPGSRAPAGRSSWPAGPGPTWS